MSELLTEQELREALLPIWGGALDFATSKDFKGYSPESRDAIHETYKKAVIDEAIHLIQSQKLAHADMVIGGDENIPNRSSFNIPAVHAKVRDNLRSQQRERNK